MQRWRRSSSLFRTPHPQRQLPSTAKTGCHTPFENRALTISRTSTLMIDFVWCHPPCAPVWRGRTDHTAHPAGLQGSPVAEGGDLAYALSRTRKAARACGCAAEDHRFHLESCCPWLFNHRRTERRKRRLCNSISCAEAEFSCTHNQLNQHINYRFRLVPSPMCPPLWRGRTDPSITLEIDAKPDKTNRKTKTKKQLSCLDFVSAVVYCLPMCRYKWLPILTSSVQFSSVQFKMGCTYISC